MKVGHEDTGLRIENGANFGVDGAQNVDFLARGSAGTACKLCPSVRPVCADGQWSKGDWSCGYVSNR